MAKLLTLMSIVLPIAIIVTLNYPFDAKSGMLYYRCMGEYDKLYDFETGLEKKWGWCDNKGLACLVIRTIFFFMASNGSEIFLLGFAMWKIVKQSENVSDMLNVNTVRNRRR